MLHMKFGAVFMDLVNRASDGSLTLVEVSEVLEKHFPDTFSELYDAVKEAGSDGEYSIMDIVSIVVSLV